LGYEKISLFSTYQALHFNLHTIPKKLLELHIAGEIDLNKERGVSKTIKPQGTRITKDVG